MKPLAEPKVEFIELSADVIATSGDTCPTKCPTDCIAVCQGDCQNVTPAE